MEHCIIILPRENPVCFSIETDHGVFDFSGLQQIPNCSQEIPNNMKATHAQDELACFFVFFFRRPSTLNILPGQVDGLYLVQVFKIDLE